MESIVAIASIEGQARTAAARQPGASAQCPFPPGTGAARLYHHFYNLEQTLYTQPAPCSNPS